MTGNMYHPSFFVFFTMFCSFLWTFPVCVCYRCFSMMDTIKVVWEADQLSESGISALLKDYPLADVHQRKFYESARSSWLGVAFSSDVGRILYSNLSSGRSGKLSAEVSVGKFCNGDNARFLSLSEAEAGLAVWRDTIESRFAVNPKVREVSRVDFYSQKQVSDSRSLLAGIRRCWGGSVLYETGMQIRHSKKHLSRLYDKGVESRIPEYVDSLRQEEQLRRPKGGSLSKYVNLDDCKIHLTEVIDLINNKYGSESLIEYEDMKDFALNGTTGMILLALEQNPELMQHFKRSVNYRTWRKYSGLLGSIAMNRHGVDLRVSESDFIAIAA